MKRILKRVKIEFEGYLWVAHYVVSLKIFTEIKFKPQKGPKYRLTSKDRMLNYVYYSQDLLIRSVEISQLCLVV